VEALLDSRVTGLVMSEEFVRKHIFRRTKLERPIYVRNVDGTLNYTGPIVDTVEVEIYFKRHKERILIDVIEEQKWGVILDMPWLVHYNAKIDWRMGEVKMTRCPKECGKKWKIGRQTKSGWQKQKVKEKREDFRRPTTEEEIAIAWIVEEKDEERDEEEDLIELRTVEEIVLRWFHKYLMVFEKKESERMLTRKA